MKITRKGTDAIQGSRPMPGEPRAASTPAPAPGGEPDSISLSAMAARLAARQAGEPPVDVEQVERIKQAMREGRFTVDAEAVADKLLEFERDLLPPAP
ncbi:hypothetical protein GCM10023144_12660 [Pigmentiphaga soli]|uniref:Negative regulator of flagellin synthesis n=1 Tax=Pigmentiphaga soli TaxID=1007095 RepID=A0ABP8GPL8_9BURK